MGKTYRIEMFGKAGCEKCKILGQRLDQALTKTEWADFEKVYFDLETEEGLVEFCKAECLNPQRVPGFVVKRWDERAARYEPLPARPEPTSGRLPRGARLHGLLGVQTDYSDEGKGLITPKMIEAILAEAATA